MEKRRLWNEKMEGMSKDQLTELRMNKLKTQLKYVHDNSELYQQKFKDAGIIPEDIRTWDDFRRMPIFFSKEDELFSQEESMRRFGHGFGMHVCAPIEDVIGISATSGTTGIPTLSYINTKHDMEVNDEGWARVLWRIGVRPGDVVLHAFGLSMWIVGVPGVHAMINMGVRCVPVGAEGGTERILHMANLTRPSTLVGTPSLVEHLVERAPEVLKKEMSDLGIKRILCAGEPGAGLPEFRKKIREAYGGAKIYDMMGPATGLAIVSCDEADKATSYDEYRGMHECTPDTIIFSDDLVDPETFEPIEV